MKYVSAVVISCLLLLTGCNSYSSTTTSSPSGNPTSQAGAALATDDSLIGTDIPESVPTLTVNGIPVDPLAYAWKNTVHYPGPDFTPDLLNSIEPTALLELNLIGAGSPSTVTIRYFYELQSNGMPADTHDDSLECLEQCLVDETSNSLHFSTKFNENASFILVEVTYIRAAGSLQFASYGMLIEHLP